MPKLFEERAAKLELARTRKLFLVGFDAKTDRNLGEDQKKCLRHILI